MSETLKQESGTIRRVYVVTVKEIEVSERHVQDWLVLRKDADGSEPRGYVTRLVTKEVERVIFSCEAPERPSVAALATLVEGAQ